MGIACGMVASPDGDFGSAVGSHALAQPKVEGGMRRVCEDGIG